MARAKLRSRGVTFSMDRSRFLIALAFGLVAGAVAALGSGGDVLWPVYGARRLLAGANPYAAPYPEISTNPIYTWLYYPLPALLLCVPVAWLPDRLAIGVLCGLSYGVLAYAVWPQPARRLALLSYPVLCCLHYAQPWPLVAAAAYLAPALAPLALSKPNVALPVLLSRPAWRWLPVGVSAALCAASIPFGWLAHLGSHQNTIVSMSLFGAPLLLAALRWKRAAWRLVALTACIPLRTYDTALLTVLPASWPGALVACALGWLAWPLYGFDGWPVYLAVTAGVPALLTAPQPVRIHREAARRRAKAIPHPPHGKG